MAKIIYVLRIFPELSETFVLNEILRLEELGLRIAIFSLEQPTESIRHSQYSRLKAPVTYLPSLWRLSCHQHAHAESIACFTKYSEVLQDKVLRTGRLKLLWRFTQALHLALALRDTDAAHIHAHFANRATMVAYFASRITGVPFSFTAHAVDLYRRSVIRKELQEKVTGAKFVITISDFNHRFLKELAGDQTGRILTIRNGIDVRRFVPGARRNKRPFVFLCVARLVEKKGLEYLVEACRILRSTGMEFRCQIAGGGKLGQQLRKWIYRYGLSSQVQLLGPLPQEKVIELYQNADLFVLPSIVASDGNREGLPVAIVEALACDLPVVSTTTSGIPEVVLDNHNGLLVPERDAQALADTILRLSQNKGLCERLARNARPSVVGNYDIDETSKELFRLFSDTDA